MWHNKSKVVTFLLAILLRAHGLVPKTTRARLSSAAWDCTWCRCKFVYLDVGSNLGVQIRKLYEPKKFPDAPIHDLFKKYFPDDRSKVCSIGFEANPLHSQELVAIQDLYKMLGLHVRFFTRTAVSNRDGIESFYLDDSPERAYNGASLLQHELSKGTGTHVRLLDLSRFIIQRLPKTATILMKMDIEGGEFHILPSLLATGAMCKLEAIFAEWHDRFLPEGLDGIFNSTHLDGFIKSTLRHTPSCRTKLLDIDDESYALATTNLIPLPVSAEELSDGWKDGASFQEYRHLWDRYTDESRIH